MGRADKFPQKETQWDVIDTLSSVRTRILRQTGDDGGVITGYLLDYLVEARVFVSGNVHSMKILGFCVAKIKFTGHLEGHDFCGIFIKFVTHLQTRGQRYAAFRHFLYSKVNRLSHV